MTTITALEQHNGHSVSYELGHISGVEVAKVMGVQDEEDIQALGIATWQETRRSMNLDLLDFVNGYTQGYAMYLNGFI